MSYFYTINAYSKYDVGFRIVKIPHKTIVFTNKSLRKAIHVV